MKTICKNFLTGKCRYGDRCRFIHPTTTKLLDPPSWIYISIENLNTTEISSDEVRYSLLVGDTRKILDDIWIDNYIKMYKALNGIFRNGIGRSLSSRYVDLRMTPEVFNLPFDLGRVEEKIVELRKINPIIEEEVIKGDNSDREDSILEEKKIPKFIKEFKEKKESGNNNKEYRSNQPSSYTSRTNQSYSYNRNQLYNRDQSYNKPQQSSSYTKDQHYNRDHSFNTSYRQDSYKQDTCYKAPYFRDSSTRDPNYKSSFTRDPRYNDYNYKPPYNDPNYKPSFYKPPYKNSNYKPPHKDSSNPPYTKKDDDSDFENKNIPYNFDRK